MRRRKSSAIDLPDGIPRRRRPMHRERPLQASLIDFYRLAVPRGAAILFAVPNGEDRHEAVAIMLTGISMKRRELMDDEEYLDPYGQGVLPGVTDLILMTDGAVTTYVEVKVPPETLVIAGETVRRPAGKLNRGQKLFRARAIRLGHDIRTVTCLEDWADLLEQKGIKLRVARWWRNTATGLVPERQRVT